MSQTTTTDATL